MKKLTIILFFLPLFSRAQISADFGMGINSKANYSVNIGVRYNYSNIIVAGNFYGIATRQYNQPKMITGGSIGYKIGGFTPSIGYYSLLVNSDDKSLNSHSVGYSLEYYKPLLEDRGIFGRVFYVNKCTLVMIGFRTNF